MHKTTFLRHHAIPLLIAVLFCWFIVSGNSTKKYFIQYDSAPASSFIPDTGRHYLANYDEGYGSELTLRNALSGGNAIVVIGSSEMTRTDLRSIPYNFFNEHGIPCLGFGHEGNQTLSILTQLAVMHKDLQNSKLVIILSPGWFEDKYSKGTSLQSFLEFNNEHFLYCLNNDNAIPAEVKQHIYEYVGSKYKSIDSPTSVLKLIYYESLRKKNFLSKIVLYPVSAMQKIYVEQKSAMMSGLFSQNKAFYPFVQKEYPPVNYRCKNIEGVRFMNWDSLYTDTREKFKSISTNNPYGIENTYYDQWMRGGQPKTIRPVECENNQEYQDFLILLKLLEHFSCQPLFVMQPLNPLVYRNIHEIDPILDSIENKIKEHHFGYLKLHTSDTSKYVKGMMNDYQHMGDYAWYKIDEKTCDYFLKKHCDSTQ